MKRKDAYIRKISAEEARERFIFVTKDAVGFFPPIGQEFSLSTSEGTMVARLVAVPCECIGQPHEHHHVTVRPGISLAKGGVVQIRRAAPGQYVLS